jgi:CubicO group peptidase (beta-lactamase class C family)
MRTLTLGGSGALKLSPSTVDLVFQRQADGVDLVLETPLTFGIGYALTPTPTVPYLPAGRVAFWGGWGGSLVVMDLDRRLTITYAMNAMAPGIIGSSRSEAYVNAVYAALG